MKRIIMSGFLVIIFVNLLLLSGCSNEPNTLATSGVFHSGADSHEIQLEQGSEVRFTYKSWTLKGDITMILINPSGEEVLKMEIFDDGEIDYIADIEGAYKVIVRKSGIACRYSVKWEIN